jgi:hypothetical protein
MQKNYYDSVVIKFCVLLIVILISFSCASKEDEARELFNEALGYMMSNQEDRAIPIYKEIVEKYPGTQTAVKANQLLLIHEKGVKDKIDAIRNLLETALISFMVDNGRYPTTQEGLTALIRVPPDLPAWNGPYIENPEYADMFNYEDFGLEYKLTPK